MIVAYPGLDTVYHYHSTPRLSTNGLDSLCLHLGDTWLSPYKFRILLCEINNNADTDEASDQGLLWLPHKCLLEF